jgi:CHAT domain-containing protein/tetratricopeptide (TPR) repeat protein
MSKPQSAKTLIATGDDLLLKEHDFDGAESAYRSALEADPASAEAMFSISCVFSHRKNFDECLRWAQQALAADPGCTSAKKQIGNALLGLGRYEEALSALTVAYEAGKSELIRAQMALCCEQLGHLAEAEAHLRALLEKDPTYTTRFHAVGMFSRNPFFADCHHTLARVLQKLKRVDEAKLHYHLAKRIDPVMDLDPIYLEIMTEADLENHPGFDAPGEPNPPAENLEPIEKLKYLASANEFPLLRQRAGNYMHDKGFLGYVISILGETQRQGNYYASARLRVIADLLNGDEQPGLFEAIRSPSWRKVFEIAERVHNLEEGAERGCDLARGYAKTGAYELDRAQAALLTSLVTRFVEFEPESALPLATIAAGALSSAADVHTTRAYLTLAKCYRRVRDLPKAKYSYMCALENARTAGDEDGRLDALAGLVHLSGGGRSETELALRLLSEFISVAELRLNSAGLLWGRSTRARSLLDLGAYEESLDEAIRAVYIAQSTDISSDLLAMLSETLEHAATNAGHKIPPEVLGILSKIRQGETDSEVKRLRIEADTRLRAADARGAIPLLQRAKEIATDRMNRGDLVRVLCELGTALATLQLWAEAEEALRDALDRGAPVAAEIDLYSTWMDLGVVQQALGKNQDAIESFEAGLLEAQRQRSNERVAFAHQQLSFALVHTDGQRAVWHMGEYLRLHKEEKQTLPRNWLEGLEAFQHGEYAAAVSRWNALLKEDVPEAKDLRAIALLNLGSAHFNLGNNSEAVRSSLQAADLYVAEDDDDHAVAALLNAVRAITSLHQDTSAALSRAVKLCSSGKVSGANQLQIVSALIDSRQVKDAESIARRVLDRATSKEYRDHGLAMNAHQELGRICRQSASYSEAIKHYKAALAEAQALRDERDEGNIRGWLAIALRYANQLDEAVEQYTRAIDIAERHSDPLQAAGHRMNMASTLFMLHRAQDGKRTALDALRILDAHGRADEAARILILLDQSVPTHELSADIRSRIDRLEVDSRRSDDPFLQNWALQRAGHGARAAEGYLRSGDRYNAALAFLTEARSYLPDHPLTASVPLTRAFQIAEELGTDELEARCCTEAYWAARFANHDTDEWIKRLVSIWSRMRKELKNDHDKIAFADNVAHMVGTWVDDFVFKGRNDRAFDLLEFKHAQSLTDLIADTESNPVTLSGVQDLIGAFCRPVVVIVLAITTELLALTLRSGDTAPKSFNCVMCLEKLMALNETFRREMITFRGAGAMTWRDMARKMLEPFANEIQKDDLVVFVVDSQVQELPLHAIDLPDGEPLISRAAVVYAPNLTVLRHLASRPPAGNPIPGFLSVGVAFPDEALAVSHVFPGRAITGNAISKSVLLDQMRSTPILHLACHGHFDPASILDSGVVLGDAAAPLESDLLSVRDLMRQKLSIGLVTLSACETARGDVAVSDFISLSRAFLTAGARSVIATLWPVENRATRDLMLDFYRRVQRMRDRDGSQIDIAQCLREAQLARAPFEDRDNWAAFKLIGYPVISLQDGTHEYKSDV